MQHPRKSLHTCAGGGTIHSDAAGEALASRWCSDGRVCAAHPAKEAAPLQQAQLVPIRGWPLSTWPWAHGTTCTTTSHPVVHNPSGRHADMQTCCLLSCSTRSRSESGVTRCLRGRKSIQAPPAAAFVKRQQAAGSIPSRPPKECAPPIAAPCRRAEQCGSTAPSAVCCWTD